MSDLEAAEARLRAVEARTAGPQRPTVGSTGAAESSGCSGGCGLEEAESRIADLQRDAERLKAEAADAKEGRRKAEEALNKSRMDAEWNAERLQTLQDEMAQVRPATPGHRVLRHTKASHLDTSQ